MLEKLFKVKAKGSNVKTEVIAGLTTFLAMSYILFVNPSMLAAEDGGVSIIGMPDATKMAIFTATALASALATYIMGIYANYPVALAPGMGVNAFAGFTVMLSYGYSFEKTMAAVFVSGIIFAIISITGLRQKLINAIPLSLKHAIGAGIGFFVAFIGLKNAGIVVSSSSTFVELGNFTNRGVLLAIFGVLFTMALYARGIKGGIFYGMVATAVVGIAIGEIGMPSSVVSSVPSLAPTFGSCIKAIPELFSDPKALIVIFSFLFVDFFDTAGTLVAVGNRAGLMDDEGNLVDVNKAMMADAVGTVGGAVLGTSTVTSFVESMTGIEAGGRTGLTAVVTATCFALATFFSPLLGVVTSAVTAPALIIVGALMATSLKDVNWSDFIDATSAFMTVIVMILGYSIAEGIAVGFIVYGVLSLVAGKAKRVSPIVWTLMIIFVFHFISKTM